MSDLVGAAEIAQRLNVPRPSTIHVWIARYPDFPQPVARLKGAHVWAWPDVEAWAQQTGRLPKEKP